MSSRPEKKAPWHPPVGQSNWAGLTKVSAPKSKHPHLLFNFLALTLVTLLLLGGLETGVRFLSLGKQDPDQSVLYYQQIQFPLFEKKQLANGEWVFRPTDGRIGHEQFAYSKPANTFRIFVFGGSATHGLGYSKNVAFSHFTQDYLKEIFPGMKFEVINLGIIGFSSKQEKSLLAHVRESYDPDLLVMYCGNNEFLELHARMFVDKNLNARVLVFQDFLNHSQFYRALKSGIRRVQAGGKPGSGDAQDERFAKFAFSESEIMADLHVTAAEYAFVIDKYHQNLRQMVQSANDTPLMILTVASNLRWNDPDDLQADWIHDYLHSKNVDLAQVQYWSERQTYTHALGLLEKDLHALTAAPAPKDSLLSQISKEDIDAVHFRLGKVYEGLGNFPKAREEYEIARDLDKRSRRALSVFNQTVLETKKEFADKANLYVLDTVDFLKQKAPRGIIGYETFYDYVHFSPLGAQRLAQALAQEIVVQNLVSKKVKEQTPKPFVYEKYMDQYAEELRTRSKDFAENDRWIGFNFDKAQVTAVNLFKYRDGLESLKNMVQLGRRDPWIYAYLGNGYYFKVNEEAEALRLYREAFALTLPQDHDLRLALIENIGAIYQRQGENQKAAQTRAVAQSLKERRTSGTEVALDKILKVQ